MWSPGAREHRGAGGRSEAGDRGAVRAGGRRRETCDPWNTGVGTRGSRLQDPQRSGRQETGSQGQRDGPHVLAYVLQAAGENWGADPGFSSQ